MEFELVLNIWYWLNELVWLYLRSYDNSSSNIRDMNKFNYMWLAFIICGPSSLLIFITYPEFLEPDTITFPDFVEYESRNIEPVNRNGKIC